MYDSDDNAAVGNTTINGFKRFMKNLYCFMSVSANIYPR